jgi:lipopolysaccharide biosynthesis regulator YciM/thioredoxin-like negative regulator of GroEL
MARRRKKASTGTGRWIAMAAVVAILGWLGWSLYSGTKVASGMDAFAVEDWESAQNALSRRVAANPGDNEARYYLGVAYRHRRLDDLALAELTALRASDAWRERAFYQIVRTLLDSERISDAGREVDEMEPALAGRSLATEARGLHLLASAEKTESGILERLDRAIGSQETGRVKGAVQRILRAEDEIFRRSLSVLNTRLSENHDMADPEGLTPLFERGQKEFKAAQAAFLEAIAIAEQSPATIEPARSRYEAARIFEARRRSAQAERLRRELVAIDEARLGGDLDLAIEFRYLHRRTVESLGRQLLSEDRAQEVIEVVKLIPPGRKGRRSYGFETLLAQAHAKLENDEELLDITDHWLKEDSAPAEMHFLRGDYHFDRQEYELAIFHLEKAHNAIPGRRRYRTQLAKAYAALSNFDRAQKHWDEISRAEPRNLEAHLARIRCLEGMKWTDEARIELSRLLRENFPDRRSPEHLALREFMDEFLERNGMAPRDLYLAKKLYTEDPQNFVAGTRYLEFLMDAGDLTTARRLAARLQESLPPDHSEAFALHMASGRLALLRDEFDEAQKQFAAAAAESPYEASAFVGEARAHLGADRPEAAWRAVEKVRILAPEHEALLRLEFELHAEAGDTEAVAEKGLMLCETGPVTWTTAKRTVEALLDQEQVEPARSLLKKARALEKSDAIEQLDFALLLDRAGGFADAERLAFKIVEENADDDRIVRRAAKRFLEKGRYAVVIDALEPLVRQKELASPEILNLLAKAYEESGAIGRRLDLLARLRRRDPKAADLAVAKFCAARSAWLEILSITENARVEDRLQAPLLRIAAEAALQLKDLDRARALADDLKVEVDTEFADNALVRARLLEATGDMEGARVVLQESLMKARASRRPELRMALVNLFGRSGQATAMMESINQALANEEDATELAPVAARHIIRLGLPNAEQILSDAIDSYGAPPESLMDRGLLRLDRGDMEPALADLIAAHEATPTAHTAHALAMAYALAGDRSRLERLLVPVEMPVQPLIGAETRTHARLIVRMHRRPARELADPLAALPAPSDAEHDAYAEFVMAVAKLGEDKHENAAAAREALGRFWALDHYPWMHNQATAELERLRELLPGHRRALDLMKARLLMRDPGSWNEGVGVAARLLEESSMKDEAALMIYLEQYLANGEVSATRLLVDIMLKRDGFSDRCYRDAARLLLAAGRPEAAALLLHRSPEASPAKKLLEAQALYETGAPKRAEAILTKLPEEAQDHPEALSLKARVLLRDPERRRSAYRFANRALRDFALDDPKRLLTHARCCFAIDRDEEGWASIERWVAWRPASAAQIGAAIDAVNESKIVDGEQRDRLYSRLRLLDPAAFIRAR